MLAVYLVLLIFILVTILLVWFLLSHDRGPREPIGALWITFGFGILALFIAMVIERAFMTSGGLREAGIGLAFLLSMSVGFTEEFSKFLPLSIFIYGRKYFEEHNDGIIYFALCGLTFGMFENFLYTINLGAGVGLLRVILVPLFHASTTGIIGYYLAKKKVDGGGWWKVILALVTISVLHGLYDFGLSSRVPQFALISVMLTVLLTLGLFLFFMLSNEADRAEGISSVGNNKFCRHCGRENLNHTLYCEYCGQKS